MSRRFTVTALPRHGPAPARGPDRAAGSDRLPGRDGRGERPGTAGGAAWGRVSGARSVGRVRGGGVGQSRRIRVCGQDRVCEEGPRCRAGAVGQDSQGRGRYRAAEQGRAVGAPWGCAEWLQDGCKSAGHLRGCGDPWS